MKTYKFLILTLGTLLFASCEKELDRDLTDVSVTVATNENVRYEGNILTVRGLLSSFSFTVILITFLSSVAKSVISIFIVTGRRFR